MKEIIKYFENFDWLHKTEKKEFEGLSLVNKAKSNLLRIFKKI